MLQLWRGAEKMSAIPYMPLYVADYLADAAHLTTEEHGAYMLLIMTYWQRGKPLPADPCRLANIARMTNERWTDVQRTLSEFFVIGDGVWAHKRIESELSKFRDKSDKAKAAGKASGERRKSKTPTDAEPKPNGRSTDVQRTLNHTDTDTDTVSAAQSRAKERASGDDLKVLSDRLFEVAGPVMTSQAIAPGLAAMTIPLMWIECGCDLDRDIIPAIAAIVVRAKGKKISSWDYFTRPVSEAKARREAGLPAVELIRSNEKPKQLEAWQLPTRGRQLTSDELEQLAIAEYERENAQCQ